MAPVQLKLRKALGVVKDISSIQIAKVAGSPDLDVALVKATSHDEVPTDEKYMHELLQYISYSRGYTSACIAGLAKRLSKTHNWIVAIKALMVIHRLLRDGDSCFEQELNQSGRYGVRILNMSNFRDDSASNAWDYSAFVRTYSLFLDERLECLSSLGSSRSGKRSPRHDRSPSYDDRDRRSQYDERRSPRDGRSRNRSHGGDYDDDRREDSSRNGSKGNVPMKEMTTEMLLDKLPRLQRLLERVLGCRPTGAARINRLIQIALYSVVVESFQLYVDLSEGLHRLVEGFFEVEHSIAVKSFDVYKRAAKQNVDLASFYALCKDIGVGRSSEYPTVNKISAEQLDELEDHLRDSRAGLVRRARSPEPEARPRSPSPDRTYEDSMAMKALPAPPVSEEPQQEEPVPEVKEQPQTNGDLLNLGEDALSTAEQGDRLALALFTSSSAGNGSWEAFGSDKAGQQSGSGNAFAVPDLSGKAGWELALVETASNLSQAKQETLAGGFNPLLLDSMYEQAEARRKLASVPTGSESSVALPGGAGRPSSNVLALPAPVPVAQPGHDPFAASEVVPPPAYVQMSDMLKKQQLLAQEQQMWQQYQNEGMQGYYSMMRLYNNTNMYIPPQNSLALPYHGYGMQQTQFSYH